MREKKSSYIVLAIMGAVVLIMLTIVLLLPVFNRKLKVEITETAGVSSEETILPGVPEETLVTAVYEMKENSKKISAIYIEVFHVGSEEVTYMEIPVDTKVNLSEGLYKSLQTYGPELPQYMKLSNAAESFSAEYGLIGANRIVSELIGITVTHFVRAEEGTFSNWKELFLKEQTDKSFFEGYQSWMEKTSSDRRAEERWMYYESWQRVNTIIEEQAPGNREKDGYLLSEKQAKNRLQEILLKVSE